MASDVNADLLRVITDEFLIRRKIELYFYGLDVRDRGSLESVFADDVEVQYHTGTEGQFTQKGAKNIVDYLFDNMGNYRVRTHVGANSGIRVMGLSARATTHAVAVLWKQDRMIVRGLRYTDEFVKRDGDWRIHRREHGPLWQYEVQPSEPDIPAPALAAARAQSGKS